MKKNSFVFFTFNKQMEICNTQGKHIKFDLIRRKLCDCRLLCHMMFRSNHQRCSIEIGVLKTSTKFTGKHQCQSLFFNKVAGLRSVTLLKKRLWHKCLPVNFVKFLRTPFLQNTSGWLLLDVMSYDGITIYENNIILKRSYASLTYLLGETITKSRRGLRILLMNNFHSN